MRQFQWPVSRIDTNSAYQLATQWLSAVSMNVEALNRDFQIIVTVDSDYIHSPPGKFVPVYDVYWSKDAANSSVASVRLFMPTKTLMQLRVEDPKYILRPPLVFTNLAELLLGTNSPAQPIPQTLFNTHVNKAKTNQEIELYP